MLFSEDMFHPSAAGYALAAQQLLPALAHALGESSDELPWISRSAQHRSLVDRLRMAGAACAAGVPPGCPRRRGIRAG